MCSRFLALAGNDPRAHGPPGQTMEHSAALRQAGAQILEFVLSGALGHFQRLGVAPGDQFIRLLRQANQPVIANPPYAAVFRFKRDSILIGSIHGLSVSVLPPRQSAGVGSHFPYCRLSLRGERQRLVNLPDIQNQSGVQGVSGDNSSRSQEAPAYRLRSTLILSCRDISSQLCYHQGAFDCPF